MKILIDVLEYLHSCAALLLVRTKVRFEDSEATSGGWRDVLVNVVFRDDSDPHICEIQIVHRLFMRVRTDMGAHRDYGVFRAAMELLEWRPATTIGKGPSILQ